MIKRDKIRWGKVIIAGLLSEMSVIVLIIMLITGYKYLSAPSEAQYQLSTERIGYYVGTFGGLVSSFLFTLWISRSLDSGFVLHGVLVGAVAALLHVGLFAASGTDFQVIYVIADGLKLLGGVAAGYVAQLTPSLQRR